MFKYTYTQTFLTRHLVLPDVFGPSSFGALSPPPPLALLAPLSLRDDVLRAAGCRDAALEGDLRWRIQFGARPVPVSAWEVDDKRFGDTLTGAGGWPRSHVVPCCWAWYCAITMQLSYVT